MPVIVKRPLALIDVAEIWDYIADDSEARANAFINTIDQKFKNLSEAPHMGRSRDELGEKGCVVFQLADISYSIVRYLMVLKLCGCYITRGISNLILFLMNR